MINGRVMAPLPTHGTCPYKWRLLGYDRPADDVTRRTSWKQFAFGVYECVTCGARGKWEHGHDAEYPGAIHVIEGLDIRVIVEPVAEVII